MNYLMLGWGIRIKHTVASYPNKIVFWYLGTQASLLAKIADTGFIPSANPVSVLTDRGIPTRWETLLVTFVLWNLLFVMNNNLSRGSYPKPGICAFLAVFLLFFGSLAIWRVHWLQCLVLKPGRSLHEIKAWLIPIAIFMGLMSIAMTGIKLAGMFS
jgi:hypothetical protein